MNDKIVSLYDSNIEIRLANRFIFHVVLGMTMGAFPGSELDTGGEMVQLIEPANVLSILFAFLYLKVPPDLHGEGFEVVATLAEAVGKYEVFSAVQACNKRLAYVVLDLSSPFLADNIRYYREFLPQHAPKILVHIVKHNYPRLHNATLPHFAQAPFLSVLERLPPFYVVP